MQIGGIIMTNPSVITEVENYENLKLNSECMNVEKMISVDESTSSNNSISNLAFNLKVVNPECTDPLLVGQYL